ncbi:hypothetical protein PVK06_028388 [Gossypium arboreum]|uniref:Serine/threonine-protein phosphatase 4 regulatory subunit 3-like central domain-containing protein n=1 Tax=Gossypium arboreum TaxID=29729 RepID=A0ABR0P2U7_GOSAR|nr:hypothetical protein PVK06_028388 [Gossypium arboreum]
MLLISNFISFFLQFTVLEVYDINLYFPFITPLLILFLYHRDHICNVQRNIHFSSLNSETFHSMNSELRELPAVELSTLAIILKTVTESGIADQMRLTELILNDQDFFQKLMELFRICEDLENMDGLHMIFKIVKGIS